MRFANRTLAVAAVVAAAVATPAALLCLGCEHWIAGGYAPRPGDSLTERWTGVITSDASKFSSSKPVAMKPVVATEAEWLAARSTARLHTAVSAGATRIDLGPLDIIDVRPLLRGADLGDSEMSGAKFLVSAREAGSGRTVRIIVDAADPIAVPRVKKPDGL